MENKHLIRTLFKSLAIIGIVFFIGVSIGVIFEYLIPSEFNFNYLSQEEIYNNNIISLFRTVTYGFVSFGLYAGLFIFTLGNIIGQALAVIYLNYGIEGVVYGFFPHASIELIACTFAATVPIYFWMMIFNTFVKKVELSKRKIIITSLWILVITVVMMCVLCKMAAYIECNITENYWLEKL